MPEVMTFRNGDRATGERYEEDGRAWWRAIDTAGLEYETDEVPVLRLPLVIVAHSDGRRWIEKPDA